MIDAALLLPKILARTGDNRELNDMAAKVAWRRVIGEGLRNHAVPLRLNEKALLVAVADAVWQKQLAAMSSELIFRMNKLLRSEVVNSIEFRVVPAALKNRVSAHEHKRNQPAPLPANVISSAADIADVELRDRFIRAAENCIARREMIKSAIRNPNSAI